MNIKNDNGFAVRKVDCKSRDGRRFIATLLKLALMAIVLSFYWVWNHPGSGIQLTLQRERSLATANASLLLSSFGFLGIAALVLALFHQTAPAVERLIKRPRKATRIS